MTSLQKLATAALGLGLLALSACGGTQSTPAPVITPNPLYVQYTAVGASDAVGYGASVPCTTATPALGAADPTCPEAGASGYVPDIVRGFKSAAGFTALLQDLGISGAVIGPDIRAEGNKYNSAFGPQPCRPRTTQAIPADFLTNELPNVNPKASFATIFAGGNDVNAIVNALACGAGGTTVATQTAYITQQVTNFGHDFATLVGSVHAKAPGATIVVANIPNFANVPYAAQAPLPPTTKAQLRQALQAVSVAIDTNVINTVAPLGIPVVDLQCNPTSYDPANFYTDGFHPNDTGYALLAQAFLQQALSDKPVAPQASCSYQAIQEGVRQALAVGAPVRLPTY
jgi:lysophospholipase L1-like esterase